jgi:hypothetical protein
VIAITTAEAQIGYSRRGIIDLREWDLSADPYVQLDGEWELYMSALYSPEHIRDDRSIARDYTQFPSAWNNSAKGASGGHGYATYRTRVILSQPARLALELPHFYSNYKIWVNGKEFGGNGVVGAAKETSKPQWLPQTLILEADNDTLEMVIQASNFHHAIGGVRESIRLGKAETLMEKREIAIGVTFILCACLITIAFVFLTIFFFKPESSALYFMALCLTWGFREAFSNMYIVTSAYPDFPWDLVVRIEYISLYLTMVWAMLFLAKLFPEDVSAIFKYLFVSCNLLFTAFTLFSSTNSFTQFLPVYLSFAAVLLLYIIYVLIHAIVKERHGVWLIVSCLMLGVIVFAYDLISYEGLTSYNPVITGGGYLVMFLLMAFCLTLQYGFIRRSSVRRDVLTYDDLYGRSKK